MLAFGPIRAIIAIARITIAIPTGAGG